jgi:hypothetical protein
LRNSESRIGVREGQNFGDRDAAGPMGEEKRTGGAEAPPPVRKK